jgi:hypothetical protein
MAKVLWPRGREHRNYKRGECYSFLMLLNWAIIRGWRKIGQVVHEMAEVSMLPCIAWVVVMFGKTRKQPITRHWKNNQAWWEGEQWAK